MFCLQNSTKTSKVLKTYYITLYLPLRFGLMLITSISEEDTCWLFHSIDTLFFENQVSRPINRKSVTMFKASFKQLLFNTTILNYNFNRTTLYICTLKKSLLLILFEMEISILVTLWSSLFIQKYEVFEVSFV